MILAQRPLCDLGSVSVADLNVMLIPDPLCHHKHCSCGTKKVSRAMDLGSGENDKKQPTIRYASGNPLYRWSFASVAVVPDQEARWLQEKNMSDDFDEWYWPTFDF